MTPCTVADIPTPALLVDVPAMERNIRRMAAFFAQGSVQAAAARPLRVFWRGRWHNVDRVEHQEQHPDRRCFTVRLAPDDLSQDDTRLRLCYDYANDAWSARPS